MIFGCYFRVELGGCRMKFCTTIVLICKIERVRAHKGWDRQTLKRQILRRWVFFYPTSFIPHSRRIVLLEDRHRLDLLVGLGHTILHHMAVDQVGRTTDRLAGVLIDRVIRP
jgi:hypothetical protein